MLRRCVQTTGTIFDVDGNEPMDRQIAEMRRVRQTIQDMDEFTDAERDNLDQLIDQEERRMATLKTNFQALHERRKAAKRRLDARTMILNQANRELDLGKMYDIFRGEHERLAQEATTDETS